MGGEGDMGGEAVRTRAFKAKITDLLNGMG